jgi:hypothetical protein
MKSLLDTLAEMIAERDLPALLIGGHAASLLGNPRSTFDVDLLIPRESSGEWQQALESIGLKKFHQTSNFIQYEPAANWPVPPVDLMLVDSQSFAGLCSHARPGIGALKTPDARGFLALKLHSARQRPGESAERDWSDIRAVIRANSLSLQDPTLREIIQRHGGAEAIDKLEQDPGA